MRGIFPPTGACTYVRTKSIWPAAKLISRGSVLIPAVYGIVTELDPPLKVSLVGPDMRAPDEFKTTAEASSVISLA